MIENVDVNGFEISADDMAKMDALDEGLVTDWCVFLTLRHPAASRTSCLLFHFYVTDPAAG